MPGKTPARPVFDAPIHVIAARDGTVTVFLPDGHSLVLTAEAAVRSGSMLARTRPRTPVGQFKPTLVRAERMP